MKIFVKAKTGQKENKIIPPALRLIPEDEEWYTISVKERPIKGMANDAMIKLIAEHFDVSRSQVELISGAISKRKVFEIKI
jgi:uncharacterized protein YggU (UPF0235/DUF167 family)